MQCYSIQRYSFLKVKDIKEIMAHYHATKSILKRVSGETSTAIEVLEKELMPMLFKEKDVLLNEKHMLHLIIILMRQEPKKNTAAENVFQALINKCKNAGINIVSLKKRLEELDCKEAMNYELHRCCKSIGHIDNFISLLELLKKYGLLEKKIDFILKNPEKIPSFYTQTKRVILKISPNYDKNYYAKVLEFLFVLEKYDITLNGDYLDNIGEGFLAYSEAAYDKFIIRLNELGLLKPCIIFALIMINRYDSGFTDLHLDSIIARLIFLKDNPNYSERLNDLDFLKSMVYITFYNYKQSDEKNDYINKVEFVYNRKKEMDSFPIKLERFGWSKLFKEFLLLSGLCENFDLIYKFNAIPIKNKVHALNILLYEYCDKLKIKKFFEDIIKCFENKYFKNKIFFYNAFSKNVCMIMSIYKILDLFSKLLFNKEMGAFDVELIFADLLEIENQDIMNDIEKTLHKLQQSCGFFQWYGSTRYYEKLIEIDQMNIVKKIINNPIDIYKSLENWSWLFEHEKNSDRAMQAEIMFYVIKHPLYAQYDGFRDIFIWMKKYDILSELYRIFIMPNMEAGLSLLSVYIKGGVEELKKLEIVRTTFIKLDAKSYNFKIPGKEKNDSEDLYASLWGEDSCIRNCVNNNKYYFERLLQFINEVIKNDQKPRTIKNTQNIGLLAAFVRANKDNKLKYSILPILKQGLIFNFTVDDNSQNHKHSMDLDYNAIIEKIDLLWVGLHRKRVDLFFHQPCSADENRLMNMLSAMYRKLEKHEQSDLRSRLVILKEVLCDIYIIANKDRSVYTSLEISRRADSIKYIIDSIDTLINCDIEKASMLEINNNQELKKCI